MWPTRELYTAGLLAYALGTAGGLAAHFLKRAGPRIASLLCFVSLSGALLQCSASLGALFSGADLAWWLSSGVPYLRYGVRLDALSAYFNLTLSLLAAA